MSDSIPEILADLRQDHRNMSILLNLLERESDRVYEADAADFELIGSIMQYMTVYPDAVHHPKEDKLYAELKAARPDLATGMARITSEHRKIAEQGVALRTMVDGVIAGEPTPRKTVVTCAVRYIDSLRRHMHWEEQDLFRRIDRMVADGHSILKISTMINGTDPLFGNKVEKRFGLLFESLARAAD